MEYSYMILKVVLALIGIIVLMLLSLKLSQSKLSGLSENKVTKIIDKVQVTKDTSICIIKIADRGYIVSISSGNTTLLKELSQEEIIEIELSKKREIEKITKAYDNLYDKGTQVFKKFKKGKMSEYEK